MNRLWIAALFVLALGIAQMLSLRVDTNPSGIFGDGAAPITALETQAGRQGAILIQAKDRDTRLRLAASALKLLEHPAIEQVSSGPETGDTTTLEWLWRHRFRLAPPTSEDLTPEQMKHRMTEAVDVLTRSEGMVLGDRLLRDPTGSFNRLLKRLDALRPNLGSDGGFWQVKNGGTLLFLTFTDEPLNVRTLGPLTTSLRALSDGTNASIHLAGPRFISTEVSAATERGAMLAGGIASVLLILWLLYALRDWRGFASVLLPLALGLGTAALAIQTMFGSVHVIALGFGGALAGLALDYPLHLAGHGESGSSRARRLIGIGAATTVTAFLAMTGAGLEVLTQTGLFVAIGLGVAAFASMALGRAPAETRALPMERLGWHLPGGIVTLAAFVVVGAAMVWSAPAMQQRPLFDLPSQTEEDLATIREAVAMPITRQLLVVSGEDADQVLQREADLQPILTAAVYAGELQGFRMAADLVSPVSEQVQPMPEPAMMRPVFEQALVLAGLQPDYATVLQQTYAEAQQAPMVSPEDLRARPDLAPLLSGLLQGESGSQDTVVLLPPINAPALKARLDSAALDGVQFDDLADNILAAIAELRATSAMWLGIGAGFATLVLALMLRDVSALIRIVFTVGAALALTAGFLSATLGTLTVFQIVALTLVVGIGVDYALFLDPRAQRDERVLAARSVSLCAGSTLLAFVTMAWSDVRVMGEIGLTVSLGVLLVIVLSMGMMGRQGRQNSGNQ